MKAVLISIQPKYQFIAGFIDSIVAIIFIKKLLTF